MQAGLGFNFCSSLKIFRFAAWVHGNFLALHGNLEDE